MVFQNYALWPHMSVFKNVAYGLQLRKLPKETIRERVHEMLRLVNLSHHMNSHPGQISGGEQQRVALARALVLEPKVLLLDEPLSNLDAKLRLQVRDDIREIQQRLGITTVLVTHDQDEALSISDRIAVMNAGRIEQYAVPGVLYREPTTRFVAEFVGSRNFYSGQVTEDAVVLASGDVRVPCARMSACPPGTVEVAVRPEDVLMEAHTDGSLGVPATVVRTLPRGHYTEVVARIGEQTVRAFLGADFSAEQVRVSFRRALVYREGVLVRDGGADAPSAPLGADAATGIGIGP
jgi:putative spermidine/putrescine transport system ATP-binding protein